jgi:flagellar protein FliO/FliZ
MTLKLWHAVSIFWLMAAFPAMAEPAAPQAQTQTQLISGATRTPDTLSTLVSLGLGLLAVIAIIYGCAWLIRRMTGMTGMNNSVIKVVSVMALGTRERIAVVDVAGQQLLLGITPGTIRTLHVFDEPVVSVGGSAPSGEFARKLQSLMNKTQAPNAAADSFDRPTNDRKS